MRVRNSSRRSNHRRVVYSNNFQKFWSVEYFTGLSLRVVVIVRIVAAAAAAAAAAILGKQKEE